MKSCDLNGAYYLPGVKKDELAGRDTLFERDCRVGCRTNSPTSTRREGMILGISGFG